MECVFMAKNECFDLSSEVVGDGPTGTTWPGRYALLGSPAVRSGSNPGIEQNAVCGQPMFAESGLGTSVPLFDAGKIDGRGTLVDGYTCNARTGFDLANKEGGIYSAEKNSTLPAEKNSPLSTEKRWWEFWK